MARIDMRFSVATLGRKSLIPCTFCSEKFEAYAVKLSQKAHDFNYQDVIPSNCPRCIVRIGYAIQQEYPYRSFRDPMIEHEPDMDVPSGKRKLFDIS